MTTLCASYDLERGPVSFDVVPFLARAMLERDRRGCSGLHIVFVPHEGGLAGFARHWGEHDAAATAWRFTHILAASCPLAGATCALAPTRAHALAMRDLGPAWFPEEKRFYMPSFVVEAARAGERIPRLRATPEARRIVESWLGSHRRPLITITQRRQSTHADRNTDEGELGRVAEYFRGKCGARVEVLDDTMRALEAGRGFAELDPDLRLAIYEAADLNIIGNNGPAELLRYSKAPYLQIGVAQPAARWAAHYQEFVRLDWGAQFPWAHARQRMVWEVLPAAGIVQHAEQLLREAA